ncbi:MAG: ABC-three component system middle component 6 [Salinispira sp.]
MIMPTKYLREDEALIGVSAALLPLLEKSGNLSVLWEAAKKIDAIGSFERFILAMDFLYMLGLVDVRNNEIVSIRL